MAEGKKPEILVIACEVLKNELEAVSGPGVRFEYIEQGIHRTPTKMPAVIQEAINKADSKADIIVLGYGLCGSGIIGVKAGKRPLVVPRAHDCVTLFLGSIKAHEKVHESHPGTYYLTKGWIEQAKSPLKQLEEYTERYGRETAEWVISEEYKHYTRIVLITTGTYDPAEYREHALANAAYLGLAYEEIEGNPAFFEKIVGGQWDKKDFFILQPGEEISQKMLLALVEEKLPTAR